MILGPWWLCDWAVAVGLLLGWEIQGLASERQDEIG